MTLYELTGEYVELKNLQTLLEAAPEEGGDESSTYEQAVKDTLEMVRMDFEDKADGYGMVIRNLEAEAAELKAQEDILKEEVTRLADRRKGLEKRVDQLKYAMMGALIATGQKTLKTEKFTFGTRRSSSLVLTTENVYEIPDELLRYRDPEPDKAAIKEYMKTHPDVTWARIDTKTSLSIR